MKDRPFKIHLRTRLYSLWSAVRIAMLRHWYGMNIGDRVRISGKARLDKTFGRGIHIGDGTLVSFDVAILTHDFINNRHRHTRVGSYSFVGAGSILLPGVTVGDHCVIGAGSVVTSDIPSRSIAVGNPARVVRSNIETARWGILLESFPDQRRFELNPAGADTGFVVPSARNGR